MIKAKNKRLEITLTEEEMKLLNSLSTRFNITKSTVIKQAIKVFAAKRNHYVSISYKEIQEDDFKPTPEDEKKPTTAELKELDREWKKMFEEYEDKKPETKDEGDLPF